MATPLPSLPPPPPGNKSPTVQTTRASLLSKTERAKARADTCATNLKLAKTAETESADAAKARDAAADHASEAHLRATAAHAAADVPSSSDEVDGEPKENKDAKVGDDLRHALLMHEAAAILNLHAQAVGVQNIRSLVPIVLDLNAGNYAWWRDQFLLAVGKFSLEDHVLRDPPAYAFPDWTRMDCVVKSWIYNTISNDLADTAMERDTTARDAWLAHKTQFLGNKETRVLYLDTEFRQFAQGDLSITDYCRNFKQMAKKLRDLGETVTDRTLILNVIRGLNDRFTAIDLHLRRAWPFPNFDQATADLLMEELNMANHSSGPPTALVASTGGQRQGAPSPPAPSRPAKGTSGSGDGGHGQQPKSKKKGGKLR
ncbi:unnamed protein product [Urochloa humidicola]